MGDMLNYIMIIIYMIVAIVDMYKMLLIIQESHYHFSSFRIIIKKAFLSYTYFLLFPLFSMFYDGIDLIIFNCCSICILGLYVYLRTRRKHILKLNFTKRIKRLCILILLLNVLSIYIMIINNLIYLSPLLMLVNIIYLFISLIILTPVEKLIEYSYYTKAKRKIEEIKPLVIGITGSCGKTSCKHYLYQMLKDKYITFMTPKSYNTCNGISKSILENMNKFTEIAIIEYGASHLGDIEKSLKIVKPEISLITNISLQHLETFVTEDNIKKEKTLLMKNSKVHFYNKLSNYNLDCEKCISFSLEKGGDYYVKDIIYKENKTNFKIVCKTIDDKSSNETLEEVMIETKLLGKTNVINICSCFAICKYLGLDNKYIVNRIKNLKPVPSRLEVIRRDENIIINDSFNSNKLGFIEALNVLNLFKEYKKYVITPGVVTGGKEMSAINEDIAYKIMGIANSCYLVESISSDYFGKVFDSKLYNYHKYESFKDAYDNVMKIKGKKVILIENDITDIYRR